jgi:hypothetical protein
MNYTQLVQAIQDYTETSETTFVSNIPNFVQLAEERIYNTVQLPALRKNVTGTATTGNKYLSLPSDWLADYSIAIIQTDGSYEFLLNKDVNYIREAYPTPSSTGLPKHYAIFDANTFILGPTPDANYSVEMHYFYYPQSIVAANTTWLGDNFESVLLYGALREAVIYQKGEQDMVNYYEQKYQESLALLKQLGDAKDRMDAYRSGQVRYPVK